MKRTLKLLAIMIIVTMLMPFTIVNATSNKTQKVLEIFNSIDELKEINGTATYENGNIEITYSNCNPSYKTLNFQCKNNVIMYNSGNITNYDEAVDSTNYLIYSIMFIRSALKLNGYTEKQIDNFIKSETVELDYEVNGIEIKELGKEKEYVSADGSESVTATPISIKIDVSKANTNTSSSDEINITKTTIKDVVSDLKSDKDFTNYKGEDGTLVFENEITYKDNCIIIEHTDYYYNYNYVTFDCADDILSFEVEKITSYEEANYVAEHEFWATLFIYSALRANGYTEEQINNYFKSEDGDFDYELNGIEIKELGKEKKYTSDDGTESTTVAPISIKIDFSKANIEKASKEYKVLNGADQTFDISNSGELTFRFDIDYSKFKEDGKVYIDGNLVDSSNYTSKEDNF